MNKKPKTNSFLSIEISNVPNVKINLCFPTCPDFSSYVFNFPTRVIFMLKNNCSLLGRFAVQALKKVNFAAAFEAIPKTLPNANVRNKFKLI